MRKIVFLVSTAAISFLLSCNETASTTGGGMSEAAKKNLDAFHTVAKAFDTGDTSQINNVVAADFVNHTPYGDVKGPDSLKAMIIMMKGAGTMTSETKKEFADDEYVFAWLNWKGTSNGTMPDMPAGPFDMNGVEVVRFKDGKAVEHWAFMPPPPPMANTPQQQSPSTATPSSTDKRQ